jgi:hypothetical protein
MKKIVFYFAIGISIILLISIIQIIVTDFDRLTKYGFGYLTGKIILLLVFLIISYFSRNYKTENKITKI